MSAKTLDVVVGTTLTESSDGVVQTAAGIARAMGARLHLVSAFEVPPLNLGGPFEPVAYTLPTYAGEMKDRLQPQMDDQIRRLAPGADGTVATEIVEGPAHRVLARSADRLDAALVVVGAAESRLALALGSTASRLIRSCECPVLVLGRPLPLPPRKVLLPVDLSPLSGEAVEAGLDLLARIAGPGAAHDAIAIEALTVVAPAGFETFLPRPDAAAVQATARRELEAFVAAHHGAAWHIGYTAAAGAPRDEILTAIRAAQPDLVIAGTHGRGGFERLLLGSVAEALVNFCDTNLVVVPPRAARERRGGATEPSSAQSAA